MFGLFPPEKSLQNNYTTDDPLSRRRLSLYESSIWAPVPPSDRNPPVDLNMVPENVASFRRNDMAGHMSNVPIANRDYMMQQPNQEYLNGPNMNIGGMSSSPTSQWSPTQRMQNNMLCSEHTRLGSGEFNLSLMEPGLNYFSALDQGRGFVPPTNIPNLWNESPWRNSFAQEAQEAHGMPMGMYSGNGQRRMSAATPLSVSNVAPGSRSNFMHGVNLNSSPPQTMYTATFRRHSYNDDFGIRSQKLNQGSIPAYQPNQSATKSPHMAPQQPESHEESDAFSAVYQYFSEDPHERVKVTKEYLEQRFFDEEKYLGELYQLPKFPVETLLRNYQLVLVGFKAGRIDVFYIAESLEELKLVKVGDLVIVEADRGRDLGKVVKMNISIDEARLLKLLQFLEQQAALSENSNVNDISVRSLQTGGHHGHHGANPPPTLHFPKSVVSLAQPNEILQILNKNQDEEKACRLCLAKIASTTNMLSSGDSTSTMTSTDLMQIKLIDAEYQFDRRKLIFYYSTSKRIDFRDLVRELFRIYKTRIWMCAVNGIPYVPQHQKGKGSRGSNLGRSHGRNGLAGNNSGHGVNSNNSNSATGEDGAPHGTGNGNQRMTQISPITTSHQGNKLHNHIAPGGFMERQSSYHESPVYRLQNDNLREHVVPRHYQDGRIDEESNSKKDSGESLVLKLLVDTLNH